MLALLLDVTKMRCRWCRRPVWWLRQGWPAAVDTERWGVRRWFWQGSRVGGGAMRSLSGLSWINRPTIKAGRRTGRGRDCWTVAMVTIVLRIVVAGQAQLVNSTRRCFASRLQIRRTTRLSVRCRLVFVYDELHYAFLKSNGITWPTVCDI